MNVNIISVNIIMKTNEPWLSFGISANDIPDVSCLRPILTTAKLSELFSHSRLNKMW